MRSQRPQINGEDANLIAASCAGVIRQSCRMGALVSSISKMLRELERLALVVRFEVGTVEGVRSCCHVLIDQPADDLAVLDDEGHIPRADLENGPRALATGAAMAEAGIEEACANIL